MEPSPLLPGSLLLLLSLPTEQVPHSLTPDAPSKADPGHPHSAPLLIVTLALDLQGLTSMFWGFPSLTILCGLHTPCLYFLAARSL